MIVFGIFSILLIATALAVVALKHPINSALALILHLLAVAGVFAALDAHFLAAVQVIVYAGAIMVLVLFLIMLLSIQSPTVKPHNPTVLILGIAASVSFLLLALNLLRNSFGDGTFDDLGIGGGSSQLVTHSPVVGSVKAMGMLLYTKYVFTFEVTSLLILAAVVGAVVIAKRNYRSYGNSSR